MVPCFPVNGWPSACQCEVVDEFLILLCLHMQLLRYLPNCLCFDPWVFSLLRFQFSDSSGECASSCVALSCLPALTHHNLFHLFFCASHPWLHFTEFKIPKDRWFTLSDLQCTKGRIIHSQPQAAPYRTLRHFAISCRTKPLQQYCLPALSSSCGQLHKTDSDATSLTPWPPPNSQLD